MGRKPKLAPQQREALIARLQEGESARTLAREFGIAPSNVYRWWARARRPSASTAGRLVERNLQSDGVPASLGRSLVAASFARVDLLCQAGSPEPALSILRDVAWSTGDGNVKIEALARLAEISCELDRISQAQSSLAAARSCARRTGMNAAAEAELTSAEARLAYARHDLPALERSAGRLEAIAARHPPSDRIGRLVARAFVDLGYLSYFFHDIPAAARAAERGAAIQHGLAYVPPHERVNALIALGCIQWREPDRVQDAVRHNREAILLALDNAMPVQAIRGLYNLLYHAAFCDERFAQQSVLFASAILGPTPASSGIAASDPMLAAVGSAADGNLAKALEWIGVAHQRSVACTFDPSPSLTTLHARVLFRLQRYGEAERIASAAVGAWDAYEQGGQGYALRVRAEALAALGRRREAGHVAVDAVAALERSMPIHHLFAAYSVAHRTTQASTYSDRLNDLRNAVAAGRRAHAAGLTPREREVAQLAAGGWTNRAIGAELGISPKTVAHYLASVFAELQIRARWQLTPALLAEAAPRRRQ